MHLALIRSSGVSLTSGLSGVASGLVIIAALAGAVAYFVTNYAKEQAKNAEKLAAGLRLDRDDQAARIQRLSEELDELRKELVAERSAREILQRHVTGRDLMEELKADIGRYHEAVTHGILQVHSTMNEVVDVLQEIKEGLAAA